MATSTRGLGLGLDGTRGGDGPGLVPGEPDVGRGCEGGDGAAGGVVAPGEAGCVGGEAPAARSAAKAGFTATSAGARFLFLPRKNITAGDAGG